MSSARGRNKFCLSLDNSSSSISSNTTHLNRWSEVVPPKTALTFAALWDPEDGMVTFSGAALLESESLPGRLPHTDAMDEDYSQFITLERDIDGDATPGENTATLATFQDVFKAFLRHTPWDSREHLNTKAGQSGPRGMQTRASSTFDGLDVYSHDVQFKPRRSVQLSCIDLLDMETSFRTPSAYGRLRLRPDLMMDSYRPELESESSSGSKPPNLNSRFSTTTASMSNFIDVATSTVQSVHISETFPIPEWTQPNDCPSPVSPCAFPPRARRVLRKRRPFDGNVTTSYAITSAPSTPRKVEPKPSKSPSSRSLFSPASVSSLSTALGGEEERRGQFIHPTSGLISPAPAPTRRNTLTKTPRLKSPVSPSSRSLFSPASMSSLSTALAGEEERRGQFTHLTDGLISPAPEPTPRRNTLTKSPRLKMRFAFLPKRKSRQTSLDSEGWVCIEITPVIRQRYIADLDED